MTTTTDTALFDAAEEKREERAKKAREALPTLTAAYEALGAVDDLSWLSSLTEGAVQEASNRIAEAEALCMGILGDDEDPEPKQYGAFWEEPDGPCFTNILAQNLAEAERKLTEDHREHRGAKGWWTLPSGDETPIIW